MTPSGITTTAGTGKSNAYLASFALEDGVWIAEIDGIPEVHTFARTLGKAREYIVDALALWLSEPVDAIRDRVQFNIPELPDSIREQVQLANAYRAAVEAIAEQSTEFTTAAAAGLVREGHLSIRDAAEVLGLSHQRVHQLLPDAERAIAATAELRAKAKEAQDRQDAAAIALREFLAQSGKLPTGEPVDGRVLAGILIGIVVIGILSRGR